MYGTVARLQVKPDGIEELKKMSESYDRSPGSTGFYLYQLDENPSEMFLVVMFQDKAAYRANAESPEQHQRFQAMRELLVADPEWHDGEVIVTQQF